MLKIDIYEGIGPNSSTIWGGGDWGYLQTEEEILTQKAEINRWVEKITQWKVSLSELLVKYEYNEIKGKWVVPVAWMAGKCIQSFAKKFWRK